VHRVQIGSVNVDEINATGDWLAGLVRDRALPQKLLLLHQFRTSMIVGRERLDTGHDELATMVHADGFGTQEMKRDTWNALRANSPNVFWGWKNFIDEDRPMLDPAQTLQVSGDIVFVSYQ
jgi:phage tail tube protein FII